MLLLATAKQDAMAGRWKRLEQLEHLELARGRHLSAAETQRGG